MAMRTFAEPRALFHELARSSRPFTDGYHTLNSHLKREEWSVPRAVSRLECTMVPLSFLDTLFQPRFLLQELIFLSSKMDGVWSGRSRWLCKGRTSQISTTSSTPREDAQFGLRGDQDGESEHPGPIMEALIRALLDANNVVLLGDLCVHSLDKFSFH